jgi:hypothetical protein
MCLCFFKRVLELTLEPNSITLPGSAYGCHRRKNMTVIWTFAAMGCGCWGLVGLGLHARAFPERAEPTFYTHYLASELCLSLPQMTNRLIPE